MSSPAAWNTTPSDFPWSIWRKNKWLVSDQPGGDSSTDLGWPMQWRGAVNHLPSVCGLPGCSRVQGTQVQGTRVLPGCVGGCREAFP